MFSLQIKLGVVHLSDNTQSIFRCADCLFLYPGTYPAENLESGKIEPAKDSVVL